MTAAPGLASRIPERLRARLSETAGTRRRWRLAALASSLAGIAVFWLSLQWNGETVASAIAAMTAFCVMIASFAYAIILLGRPVRDLAQMVAGDWAAEQGFDYSPDAGTEAFDKLRSACLTVRFVKARFTHRMSGRLSDRPFEMGAFATTIGEDSEDGRFFMFDRREAATGRIVVRPSHGWMDFGSSMAEIRCEDDALFSKWIKIFAQARVEAKKWATAERREFITRLMAMGGNRFLADLDADRAFILLYGRLLVRAGSRFLPIGAEERAARVRASLDQSLELAREMIERLD